MEALRLADSFLVSVRNGVAGTAGLDLHLARFADGVRQLAADDPSIVEQVSAFFADAIMQISEYGAGNPRLELHADSSLHLLLRPTPKLTHEIALVSAGATPRVTPQFKGPNISAYLRLNRVLGAEAVMHTASTQVAEGATTALLWWEDNTLYSVRSTDRVASVTEQLVVAVAEALGYTHNHGSISMTELAAHEVWAVNALHGIRLATHLDGRPLPAAQTNRLTQFQQAYAEMWEPLTGSHMSQNSH